MAAKQDLIIYKGKTYQQVVRWEAGPIIYKPITAISQAAPVVITCASHGIPDQWRVAIQSVKGMTEINSPDDPPRDRDYHQATVVDTNTISFNDINSLGYKTYTSGGVLRYLTPVDLTGFTARMSIKDKVGGTELLRLDTTNSRIVLNSTASTITLVISATDTAAITFTKGVYDLELQSLGGIVTALLYGKVSIEQEVTTT